MSESSLPTGEAKIERYVPYAGTARYRVVADPQAFMIQDQRPSSDQTWEMAAVFNAQAPGAKTEAEWYCTWLNLRDARKAVNADPEAV